MYANQLCWEFRSIRMRYRISSKQANLNGNNILYQKGAQTTRLSLFHPIKWVSVLVMNSLLYLCGVYDDPKLWGKTFSERNFWKLAVETCMCNTNNIQVDAENIEFPKPSKTKQVQQRMENFETWCHKTQFKY